MAFTAAYLIALELSLGFSCRPVAKLIHPELPGKCLSIAKHVRVQAWINAVSDILIFLLPLPAALRLQLPKRQKFALIFVFAVASV